ncbi:hypothetical protein QYF61_016550 [Mycteria americana]|uniref:Uncharacterized protein n=1 Tax=Mycteria americana TaxID=33587 RepID=A0AAN7S6M7_MYCAM|nr:hypothetical protein QYF61_016550 [Mycteria americana]
MSLQCRDKDVVRNIVKCFVQVQVDDINCSSLHHQRCNPIVEDHQICPARFALSEAMLAVASRLFIFHVPKHSFQEDLLHDLARHRGLYPWYSTKQIPEESKACSPEVQGSPLLLTCDPSPGSGHLLLALASNWAAAQTADLALDSAEEVKGCMPVFPCSSAFRFRDN